MALAGSACCNRNACAQAWAQDGAGCLAEAALTLPKERGDRLLKAFEPHAATGFQRITYWWKKHLAESRVLQAHRDQPSKDKEGREEGSTREGGETHTQTHILQGWGDLCCQPNSFPCIWQAAPHHRVPPLAAGHTHTHTHIYICRSAGRTRQQSRGNRCCSSCSGWGRGPGHCQQYARRWQIRWQQPEGPWKKRLMLPKCTLLRPEKGQGRKEGASGWWLG